LLKFAEWGTLILLVFAFNFYEMRRKLHDRAICI